MKKNNITISPKAVYDNKRVEIKHEMRIYQCGICKASFMHKLNYDLHLSNHNENKNNCCTW